MIDKEHLEQAGLRALDLLEDRERLLFDRELRVNPHLLGALRDASDQLAAVALTAPQAVPPAGIWSGIESRLAGRHATLGQQWTRSLRRRRFQSGWAAAAALAVLSSWLSVRNYQLSSRAGQADPPLQAGRQDHSLPGSSGRRASPFPSQVPGADSEDPSRIVDGGGRPLPGTRMMRVVNPSHPIVRGLDSLRPDGQKESPIPAGIADLRIMELHPPGSEAPSLRDRSLLVGKVAEAIAASTASKPPNTPGPANPGPDSNPTPPVEPPAPAVLHGGGSAPSSDIVIEKGGTINIGALNLHPDAQVVHQDFPADDEFQRYGLTRIDDGRVWDGHGGIWHRQADGHTYVGQRAPDGFQPPDPDDPGTVSPSPLRPAPAGKAADSGQNTGLSGSAVAGGNVASPHAPEPYAMPVISSDGQGMIVTRNLPEPASGYGYALWSQGAAGGVPVLLGYLPQTGDSNGIFAFDLPAGVSVPGGYRITNQALNDSSKPGTSILQGP